jgi:hypothetical protein
VAGALLLGLPAVGVGLEATRTTVFLYTGLAQLAFAYPARRLGARPLPNPALHLSIVFAGLVQVAVLFVPWTRVGLDLVALDAFTLVVGLLSVAVTWGGAETTGYLLNRSSFNARSIEPLEMGIDPRAGSNRNQ